MSSQAARLIPLAGVCHASAAGYAGTGRCWRSKIAGGGGAAAASSVEAAPGPHVPMSLSQLLAAAAPAWLSASVGLMGFPAEDGILHEQQHMDAAEITSCSGPTDANERSSSAFDKGNFLFALCHQYYI